jgi:hypothetical protein
LLGLWGISAFPFSPSAGAWSPGNGASWLFLLLLLPGQALLMAGFFRHVLHPGETSFESQERWARILYPAGLFLLAACSILLGLWGWDGAQVFDLWWAGIPVFLLAMGIVILALRVFPHASGAISRWGELFRLEPFYKFTDFLMHSLEAFVRIITSTLEGEGGIFWSILLLVLILSLLSAGGG